MGATTDNGESHQNCKKQVIELGLYHLPRMKECEGLGKYMTFEYLDP